MKGSVRSLFVLEKESMLLIGTQGSEIFEINLSTNTPLTKLPLISGHYENELWGLSVHPNKNLFCTSGDDKTVKKN